jgi:hypothetical protein
LQLSTRCWILEYLMERGSLQIKRMVHEFHELKTNNY